MAKYDGLSAKELRTRLLDADKHNNSLHKTCGDLEKAVLDFQNQVVELGAAVEEAKLRGNELLAQEEKRTAHASSMVRALSHDLEYERARRISAEIARFDLEQRLHGLSNTHVEVSAIREIMPGLRIDRNGDIA